MADARKDGLLEGGEWRGAERRADPRNVSVLRVAVLIRGGERQLCLVRNIGAGGAMVRTFATIAPEDRILLELKAGCQVSGRVVWASDGQAGIRFDSRIDLDEMLAPPEPKAGHRPRLPRLPVDRLAMIRSGGDISFAAAREISQGGVRLSCDHPLPQGTAVVLTLEGLRPMEGVVRWRRGDDCGISFNERIPPGDLSRWLVKLSAAADGHA